MTTCPQCGAPIEPDSSFCDMCGANLAEFTPAAPEPQPTPAPPPAPAPEPPTTAPTAAEPPPMPAPEIPLPTPVQVPTAPTAPEPPPMPVAASPSYTPAAPEPVPMLAPASPVPAPTPIAESGPAPGASAATGTLTCEQCGFTNLPGMNFCENCGGFLGQEPSSAPAPEPEAAQPEAPAAPASTPPPPTPPDAPMPEPYPPPASQPVATPPAAEPPAQVPYAAAPPAQPPAPPAAIPSPYATPAPDSHAATPAAPPPPPAPGQVTGLGYFVVQPSGDTLPIPTNKAQVIIGREDVVSNVFPDIDLDSYDALNQGVGRRHAQLTFRAGQAYIEDLDSVNGTYLGGQRLQPKQPAPLSDGDQLALGRLKLTYQAG